MAGRFRYLLIWLVFLSIYSSLNAQTILYLQTKWSDDFSEWAFYDEEENQIGELRLRWPSQNDWSEWDFSFFDVNGQLKLKWKDDPNEWELRGNNEIVTARTLWKNNFREWRISTDNNSNLTLKSRYGNVIDQWETRNRLFYIETDWEGDPRSWKIILEDAFDYSETALVALVFTSVFHSIPLE